MKYLEKAWSSGQEFERFGGVDGMVTMMVI